MDYTRRDFLQVTTGAGAFASLAPSRERPDALLAQAAPDDVTSGWFDTPMRWAQLTLVENDPGRFDPTFWIDYFTRIRADAVCLSAGGIVAYYPTEIALHHRSTSLGQSDPFGDLVKGCRAAGMHVIARSSRSTRSMESS